MSGAGSALMGIGFPRRRPRGRRGGNGDFEPAAGGQHRRGHGVLLSIQGGSDLGLFEINEAAQLVANSAAVDANIIFGAVIDDALGDEVRVTVIAAGFDENLMPDRPRRPPRHGPQPAQFVQRAGLQRRFRSAYRSGGSRPGNSPRRMYAGRNGEPGPVVRRGRVPWCGQ